MRGGVFRPRFTAPPPSQNIAGLFSRGVPAGFVDLDAVLADTLANRVDSGNALAFGVAASDAYVATVLVGEIVSLEWQAMQAGNLGLLGFIHLGVTASDSYLGSVRLAGALGLGTSVSDTYARIAGFVSSMSLGFGATVTPTFNVGLPGAIALEGHAGLAVASDFIDYAASLESRRPPQPPPEMPVITPRRLT